MKIKHSIKDCFCCSSKVRITNGYGNDTRPYILLRYMGYDIVEREGKPHYSIPINRELWKEKRTEIGGKVEQCS